MYFKELKGFSQETAAEDQIQQASFKFPSDCQSTLQKHFLPAASRQRAAHGGSRSNPALQQKGVRNFSSCFHPTAPACVQLAPQQNNAKCKTN